MAMRRCRQRGGAGLPVKPRGCRRISTLCLGRGTHKQAVFICPIISAEAEDAFTVIVVAIVAVVDSFS